MKPFAGGMINNAAVAFKFLRQHPDVIPLPGFDSVEAVDEVVSFYGHPNRVTAKDLRLMEAYRAELGKQFCRRCEYCNPCPQGVMITKAMGYQVIAGRMSPAVAVEFSRAAMESVKLCTLCGTCQERCPYELPIQDMLKRHYDLYEKHRASGCLHLFTIRGGYDVQGTGHQDCVEPAVPDCGGSLRSLPDLRLLPRQPAGPEASAMGGRDQTREPAERAKGQLQPSHPRSHRGRLEAVRAERPAPRRL